MAFPHPKSRKDKYRNEDKPSRPGVVWNLIKRTVNVTDYGDGHYDVNPAKNCTYRVLVLDVCSFGRWGHEGTPCMSMCQLVPDWGKIDEIQRAEKRQPLHSSIHEF
jgi:hypothetical protein